MTELSKSAQALIERVGDSDGPGPHRREHVRRALYASLAAGGALTGSAGVAGAQGAAVATASKSAALGGVLAGKSVTAQVAVWFAAGSLIGVGVAAPVAMSTDAPRGAPPEAAPMQAAAAPTAPVALRAPAPPAAGAQAAAEPHAPAAAPPNATAPLAASPPSARAAATPLPDVAPAAPVTGIAAEVALLKRAQQQLAAGDARASLAALDEHARTFPAGTLTAERLAARVFALCALGDAEAARTAAREFLSLAPASPLVPRVLASCAGAGGGAAEGAR
ncbi:MAG TPA: hypothetical protein VKZ49_11195 [Polyangiaceae bacterium]|nr:hypothetical protein [Polyangiaceae bacterium]